MKCLTKTLSFVLVFAMIFSMVIVPNNSIIHAEENKDSENSEKYTYFDTTMFKYDTEEFNKATKALESTTTKKEISEDAISSIPTTETDVLIVSNGYALKVGANNTIEAVKFEDINSENVDDSLLWTLSSISNNTRTIKNKSTGAYLNISVDNWNPTVSLSNSSTNLYVNSNNIYYTYNYYYYYQWYSYNYYLNYNINSNQITAEYSDNSKNNIKLYTYEDQSTTSQGIYFNNGGDITSISGTTINNKNYNKWTGKWDADGNGTIEQDTDRLYPCKGIVQSELDDNNKIAFNYPQAGIFDITQTVGKQSYTNVKMPFKSDSEGYNYYDSTEYDVKFPNNTPASDVKLEDEGLTQIKNGSNYRSSFLPFSSSTNNIDSNPQFHFGMNMSLNFQMASDKKTTTQDGTKQDMTFEFSGDDDVWVFVDGKLVLDMGGIHDCISSKINFTTGEAYVYKGTTSTIIDTINLNNILGSNWADDTNEVHTIQIFYLERGEGESNCKMRFNLKSYKSELKDDVAVLDYGKPIEIDVLANDKLYGVEKKVNSIVEDNCENGTLELSEDNTKLIYTPEKYMNSVDTAVYDVVLEQDNNTASANVSIMPATSVYYEDNFGYEQQDEGDPSVSIVWTGTWDADIYVDEDGNDLENNQDSTNKQYGWDSHYTNDKEHSGGSIHYSSESGATATFKFTGTAVDVYSKTDGNVGRIRAQLYKGDSTSAMSVLYVDGMSESDEYYQIPTLTFDNLEYGTYRVKITVMPAIVAEDGSSRGTYYLDGIRVYNPLGIAPTDPVVKQAYTQAGEYNASYKKVRDILLDAKTFNASDVNDGAVFIDKSKDGTIGDTSSDIGTYENYGPKNEVYLAKDQAIAFEINSGYEKLFVGAKSPTGADTKMTVSNGDETKEVDITSTHDMYYEINAKNGENNKKYVVIRNTGDELLSITKIRATGENYSMEVRSSSDVLNYAATFTSLKVADTDSSGMVLPDDKGDVDIDNPSDKDNTDNKGDNNNDNKDDNTNNHMSILKKIINSLKKWFKR